MKRLVTAVLAVIISCVFAGGSFILAEDSASTDIQTVSPTGSQPQAQVDSQPTNTAAQSATQVGSQPANAAAQSSAQVGSQPANTTSQSTTPVSTQKEASAGTQPEASTDIQTVSPTGSQPQAQVGLQPANATDQSTSSTDIQPQTPVAVRQAKPIGIQYSRDGVHEVVRINAEGYTDYNSFELKGPLRVVIDMKNTKAPSKQAYVKAGGAFVKLVRYAKYSVNSSRVVLEVKEGYEYSAVSDDNGITVYVTKKQAQATLDKEKAISIGKNYGIKLNTVESKDAITLSLKNHAGYRISRYTGPDRLVLTIPDAGVFGSEKKANVNTRQVGSVSYKKTGKAGAVITINLNGQFQYEASETDDQLVLTFHWPHYSNIYYNNNNDRVYFTLSGTKLTEGAKYLKTLYTEEYDETGNRYIITFPTTQSVIKEGILDINDAYLKSFEVKLNPEDGTTSLIFTGNGKNAYLVFTRESGLTTITVMKPAANGRKLVVIDAGHGGNAVGTVYGAAQEKNLNLDMAKRLDALLAKKGIRTYMVRSEDSNVDNYERVYIANKLNASLYLSIHVNAMDDRSCNGTMTLYCPSGNSGFTGKSFANILQKNLLSALRTRNRGVISRPDLIVLRETEMPSALAEIAFLSNRTDRASLLKSSFRQKAAQALCDSVIQALPKL